MRTAVLLTLALALPRAASAGELVRVDFAAGARFQPSPVVAPWTGVLGPWLVSERGSDWAGSPIAALRGLDPADPASHPALEPLVRALADSGVSPASFASAGAQARAAVGAAAAERASRAVRAGLLERAARAESSDASPSESFTQAAAALREAAALDAYLDAPTRARVRAAAKAALARQLEPELRRQLSALSEDASAVAVPDAPSGPRGRLLRFTPKKPATKRPPLIEARPGRDPGMVARGLMLGLSPDEAGRFADSVSAAAAKRDDLYTRFSGAFAAAKSEAARSGDAGELYFLEARAPLRGAVQDWSFTFFALPARGARFGRRIDVSFSARAARARPAVIEEAPAGARLFRLDPYLLGRGAAFSPADARRFAGTLVPDAEIGLTATLRAEEEPETGEVHLWYRFTRAGAEYARVNASTGQVLPPAAPRSLETAARASLWRRWLERLLSALR